MIKPLFAAFAALALSGTTVATDAAPHDPAAAIALADTTPGGAVGLFRMTVAAVGTSRNRTFLNSNSDYRSVGNVTFTLSEGAVRHLSERSGVADVRGLVGRTVVVAGRIEKRAIANVGADGRAIGFNRWGYSVRVSQPEQLVSISGD